MTSGRYHPNQMISVNFTNTTAHSTMNARCGALRKAWCLCGILPNKT